MSELDEGYVYFILSPDMEAIKIGFASDPIARVHQLNTAHYAGECELLIAVLATRREERELHDKFKHLRIKREWYSYDDENELTSLVGDLEEALGELCLGEFSMSLKEALAYREEGIVPLIEAPRP